MRGAHLRDTRCEVREMLRGRDGRAKYSRTSYLVPRTSYLEKTSHLVPRFEAIINNC